MAQPSSGTYSFQPSVAEIILEAFSRIQIRPTSITAQHMRDAYMSINYLQSAWTTAGGPNLWKVELLSIPLTQGVATYSLPQRVSNVLDWYIRLPPANNTLPTDIVMFPISRTEYADQPNKSLQARPSTLWWDRTIDSQVTLWPVPDQNGPYTLYLYFESQIQDATIPQGTTPDIPYRFYDAFAAGLAAQLAVKYSPPQMVIQAKQLYDEAWEKASNQDIEDVPWFIVPALGFYDSFR